MSEVTITLASLNKQIVNNPKFGEQTLMIIKDENGKEYTSYQGKWNSSWSEGQEVRAKLVVNGTYNNLKIPDDLKEQNQRNFKGGGGGGGGGSSVSNEKLDKIAELLEKNNALLNELVENAKNVPF